MATAFYIFKLIWPFIKELFLGSVSLKEGMRTRKRRVFLLFFVSALIMALIVIIPKFYHLSQQHLQLEKSVEEANVERLKNRITQLENHLLQNAASPPPPPLIEDGPSFTTLKNWSKKPPDEPDKPVRNPPIPRLNYDTDISARRKSYMDFFERYQD